MARTPGEGMAGSEWVRVAAACLPGLVVGLAISWADGRGGADVRAQEKMSELTVTVAKMNQLLLTACDLNTEQSNILDAIREDQKLMGERLTRLEVRVK